jgi:hypothetical protein
MPWRLPFSHQRTSEPPFALNRSGAHLQRVACTAIQRPHPFCRNGVLRGPGWCCGRRRDRRIHRLCEFCRKGYCARVIAACLFLPDKQAAILSRKRIRHGAVGDPRTAEFRVAHETPDAPFSSRALSGGASKPPGQLWRSHVNDESLLSTWCSSRPRFRFPTPGSSRRHQDTRD